MGLLSDKKQEQNRFNYISIKSVTNDFNGVVYCSEHPWQFCFNCLQRLCGHFLVLRSCEYINLKLYLHK